MIVPPVHKIRNLPVVTKTAAHTIRMLQDTEKHVYDLKPFTIIPGQSENHQWISASCVLLAGITRPRFMSSHQAQAERGQEMAGMRRALSVCLALIVAALYCSGAARSTFQPAPQLPLERAALSHSAAALPVLPVANAHPGAARWQAPPFAGGPLQLAAAEGLPQPNASAGTLSYFTVGVSMGLLAYVFSAV